MIAAIIRWSARNLLLVGFAGVFLTLAGVYAVSRVPLDAIPDLSDIQVIVYTEYPGQAPQVVEDQVTYPLTSAMLSVPKSMVVRGFSFFGASFLASAAGAAAFRDPRFNPLEKNEANEVCIELTVITNPKKIYVRNPDEYLQRIHLGKDGILVRGVFSSGYLLPVVALEKKMDPLSFLRAACAKAGLKHDEWRDFDTVNVYSFNAQVFGESEPNGNVIQLM